MNNDFGRKVLHVNSDALSYPENVKFVEVCALYAVGTAGDALCDEGGRG